MQLDFHRSHMWSIIKLSNRSFGISHSFVSLKFQAVFWGLSITSEGFWFSVAPDQLGNGSGKVFFTSFWKIFTVGIKFKLWKRKVNVLSRDKNSHFILGDNFVSKFKSHFICFSLLFSRGMRGPSQKGGRMLRKESLQPQHSLKWKEEGTQDCQSESGSSLLFCCCLYLLDKTFSTLSSGRTKAHRGFLCCFQGWEGDKCYHEWAEWLAPGAVLNSTTDLHPVRPIFHTAWITCSVFVLASFTF